MNIYTLQTSRATAHAAGLPSRRYWVARLIWHIRPGAGPFTTEELALALEALVYTPVESGSGGTLAALLESQGVAVERSSTHFACIFELRGLKESIPRAAEALASALRAGEPSEAGLLAARTTVAAMTNRRMLVLADRAELVALSALTGRRSWLARFPEGGPNELQSITADRVASALRYLGESCRVSVVASDAYAAHTMAAAFGLCAGDDAEVDEVSTGSWLSVAARHPALTTADVAGPRGAYLQWTSLVESDSMDDQVSAEIATHVIGGWFGARWQTLFREKLNKTYGTHTRVRGFAVGGRRHCLASIGMSIAGHDVADVAALVRAQLELLRRDGLTALECATAATRLRRGEALLSASSRILVASRALPLEYGLAWSGSGERAASLGRVDVHTINAMMHRMITGGVIATALGEGPRRDDNGYSQ